MACNLRDLYQLAECFCARPVPIMKFVLGALCYLSKSQVKAASVLPNHYGILGGTEILYTDWFVTGIVYKGIAVFTWTSDDHIWVADFKPGAGLVPILENIREAEVFDVLSIITGPVVICKILWTSLLDCRTVMGNWDCSTEDVVIRAHLGDYYGESRARAYCRPYLGKRYAYAKFIDIPEEAWADMIYVREFVESPQDLTCVRGLSSEYASILIRFLSHLEIRLIPR